MAKFFVSQRNFRLTQLFYGASGYVSTTSVQGGGSLTTSLCRTKAQEVQTLLLAPPTGNTIANQNFFSIPLSGVLAHSRHATV